MPKRTEATAAQQAPQTVQGEPSQPQDCEPSSVEKSPEALQSWMKNCVPSDALLKLTDTLVRFKTVAAQQSTKDGADFVAMADFLAQWAKEHGLHFSAFGGNDAWDLVYLPPGISKGTKPFLRWVTHADVVPVAAADSKTGLPAGWTVPAFATTVKEGRLYGRGTEDDKGAIAACMLLLKWLNAQNYPVPGPVVLTMGTAEEHDWDGMSAYAKAAPKATHTISVDASYPVVVAESGFVAWYLKIPEPTVPARHTPGQSASGRIESLQAGEFLTQVPGRAEATIKLPDGADAQKALMDTLRSQQDHLGKFGSFEVEIDSDTTKGTVKVVVLGHAAHSSTAEEGHNALWALAVLCDGLGLGRSASGDALQIVRHYFAGDHYGEKLGIAYEDPFMGKLLVAPTLVRSSDEGIGLSINMRRPKGQSREAFETSLADARQRMAKTLGISVNEARSPYVGKPFVADLQGPLVQTLLAVYTEHTGQKNAKAKSIRGGTYARLFEGAVDFGPSFPGKPYRGHGADEYIEVTALESLYTMLGQSMLRLGEL